MNALEKDLMPSREDRLFYALGGSYIGIEVELESYDPTTYEVVRNLLNSATNVNTVQYGTAIYSAHMEQQVRVGGKKKPYGIEINTLSHDVQLILYPRIVFPKDDALITLPPSQGEMPEDRQAILYLLDGFESDATDIPSLTANMIFAGWMAEAYHGNVFPIGNGKNSNEFKRTVEFALLQSRDYLRSLPQAKITQLSKKLRALKDLPEMDSQEYTDFYVDFQIETMSRLVEDSYPPLPEDCVEYDLEYLALTDRDLPLITEKALKYPWREFTKNRANRSGQRFGRYEIEQNGNTMLRIDYKFDEGHAPLNYGYFNALEITEYQDDEMLQHVIFGQNVEGMYEARPIIMAGDFDFSDFDNITRFINLINDPHAKREVVAVLQDILSESNIGILKRIENL